jgi:hypothetical protein
VAEGSHRGMAEGSTERGKAGVAEGSHRGMAEGSTERQSPGGISRRGPLTDPQKESERDLHTGIYAQGCMHKYPCPPHEDRRTGFNSF